MRQNLLRLRNGDRFKLPHFDRACLSGMIDGPAYLDLSLVAHVSIDRVRSFF
jgi:hypothetical protein